MADRIGTEGDSLRRIADLLGVTVDQLHSGERLELAGAVQCLLFWKQIRSEVGITRALDGLRRIVREEQKAGSSRLEHAKAD